MSNVTEILQRWHSGDSKAQNELFDAVYSDMRMRAGGLLKHQGPSAPLQPTELVNESFLKLAHHSDLNWQDRNHFLSVASIAMRQVLTDLYRQSQAQKRAGENITLVTEHLANATGPIGYPELDAALTELHEINPQLATVVELKFFSGMTNAEIAEVTEHSESTVKRNWRTARAWLLSRLNAPTNPPAV